MRKRVGQSGSGANLRGSQSAVFELAFNAIPDLMAIIDIEDKILWCNRALAARYGADARQLIGKRCCEIFHDFGQPPSSCLHRLMKSDGAEHVGEFEMASLDGHFRVTVTPLRGAYGEILGSVHVLRDVTASKRQEAALRRAREELQRCVEDRLDELAALRGQLESEAQAREAAQAAANQQREMLLRLDRVDAMGFLAASLAHELNQPLAAIMTNAQTALRMLEADKPASENLRRILDDIVADDRRAGDIIRDMRCMLQGTPTSFSNLSVSELLRKTQQLTHGDAASRGIVLQVHVPRADIRIRGCETQLLQVLLNLVLNAFEALEMHSPGRRVVRISAKSAPDNCCMISVRDSGKGIDLGNQERIFEPLCGSKMRGLGMGLAICRMIIHAHGGRIWVESNPPRGATFRFVLPRSSVGFYGGGRVEIP